MRKRERIGIQAGDLIRCPDRATARWHRVVRVGLHSLFADQGLTARRTHNEGPADRFLMDDRIPEAVGRAVGGLT